MDVLSIENVDAFYGHIHALKNVSLNVKKNEIVTLIGSNGAGKTTTLKTISGLLKPKQGKILFNGARIDGLPAHIIAEKGIAHVPEGRRIFPRLTVLENLVIGAYHIKDQKKVNSNLDKVYSLFPRLKERHKQNGGTLSGGEQQMLAIGRALMSDPEILLLDEPSMGLSPLLVEQVFNIIQELNNRGVTILLVEQNAAKALKIAHRGYVLQSGSIILTDDATKLLNNTLVREAYLG